MTRLIQDIEAHANDLMTQTGEHVAWTYSQDTNSVFFVGTTILQEQTIEELQRDK